MRQTVEVNVTLTFEANNEINPEGMAQIIENVQNALEHWEWNGALCPIYGKLRGHMPGHQA